VVISSLAPSNKLGNSGGIDFPYGKSPTYSITFQHEAAPKQYILDWDFSTCLDVESQNCDCHNTNTKSLAPHLFSSAPLHGRPHPLHIPVPTSLHIVPTKAHCRRQNSLRSRCQTVYPSRGTVSRRCSFLTPVSYMSSPLIVNPIQTYVIYIYIPPSPQPHLCQRANSRR
jgi:hypothetical protein